MSAITINLFLAVFWLFLGGFFLFYEQLFGEPLRYRLPLGQMNPGWLAVLFAVFNLYRVFWTWLYRRRRQHAVAEQEDLRQRFGRRHSEKPRSDEPPDPNFMFTEEPTAPPPEKPV